MTTFQDLQADHEALLNRQEAPADPVQFWADVQHYIERVCAEAADIPAPRERDQLRAILRFWASYVYDKTGTYPDTTLRPAMSGDRIVIPPLETEPSSLRRALIIVGALTACVIVVALLIVNTRGVTPSSGPRLVPTKEMAGAGVPTSTQALNIESTVVTSGPSPFDPTVWVVRIQLSATGGNGSYIFWINSQHLPDTSTDQFTVEGNGCTAEKPLVGVTSGGLAASQQLVISSPLPNCPAP